MPADEAAAVADRNRRRAAVRPRAREWSIATSSRRTSSSIDAAARACHGFRSGEARHGRIHDDLRRSRAGDPRLHVARAGRGNFARSRRPQRHVQPGSRAVRNAHGGATLSRQPPAVALAGAGRRPAAAAARQARCPPRSGDVCAQGDEQVPVAALSRLRGRWANDLRRYQAGPADSGPSDGARRTRPARGAAAIRWLSVFSPP